MFYCKPCSIQRQWPESFMQSHGVCEVCDKAAICFEVPSAFLPIPVPVVSGKAEVYHGQHRKEDRNG